MNKNFLLTCVSFFIASTIFAQVPEWENPKVFEVNKEKTRATALPYADVSSAIKDSYNVSPFYQSLDGKWDFLWVPKIADVPEGFYRENFSIAKWAKMPVPGNWEFNGFGIPIYTNITYPFPKNPPFINKDDSPTGMYRHEFNIPENWDGRRVFIHFEGGTTALYIWVNGQKVGYSENAKSPAEFDITQYVRKGKNLLACQVLKYADASYLEDQDMWRLGGINRSVYLYSTAQTRILDFFAHPDLDKNYKNGLFSSEIVLKNYSNETKNTTVEVAILDKSGKKVFEKVQKAVLSANNTSELKFDGNVSSPLKWTAETPHLYTLLISLKDENGNLVEATSHKIGFRKVEIKDGQFFVNGKKILFKGVNLHEFDTRTGQVVTRETMMRNLELMKGLNINAVRTSHYPQPPLWYQLCDEYGMYLVDEGNLESHGLGYGPDNVSNFSEWRDAHLDRSIRLVERDKNHPSVLIWSLGNEASNGKAFFDMYDWIKARDNSRPVQYEQAYNGRDAKNSARNTDLLVPMYPSWSSMVKYAKEDLGRPFVMCEYAHAMGNSMGNFQEYWDLMRSSKNMQGGFIWEWYNHGYATKDEQGRSYWAYGGDLGGYNQVNDGNFCMDGVISPDQNYIPHSYIVKKVYQNILFEAKDLSKGVITITNDFKFTDITPKNYSFKWVLLQNGKATAEGTFVESIKADTKKDVKLKLPKVEAKEGNEYYLQLYAYTVVAEPFITANSEMAKGELAFEVNNYFVKSESKIGTLTVEKRSDRAIVKSGDVSYEFSLKDGRSLLAMSYKDKRVFNELPYLNFWRAPIDNDFGSSEQYNLMMWNAASYNHSYLFKGIDEKENTVTLKYQVKLSGVNATVDLNYIVNFDGSLTIDAQYKTSENLPELPRFGMMMTLPKEMNNFSWYGRGPHENYVDRNADAFMGIWNGKVEKQAFEYYRPQETGNKTDVRWLKLTNDAGLGIEIAGCQALSVSATNNKPEDLDPGLNKKQQHPSDIIPRKEVVLCVDLFQRGVGGLDSWGAKPLDSYRYSAKEYKYSYTIKMVK